MAKFEGNILILNCTFEGSKTLTNEAFSMENNNENVVVWWTKNNNPIDLNSNSWFIINQFEKIGFNERI